MRGVWLVFKATAFSLIVFVPAAMGPVARAENWVQSTPRNDFGVTGCVDLDSIRRDADGFTYFRAKICEYDDVEPLRYAVRCSQISSSSMTIYEYDGSEWRPNVVEETTIAAWDAHFACRQRR